MKITICSLFPDYFSSPLACSILARAQKFGYLTVDCLNYRDFAQSADGRVDDRPYGGGPGMILQPQVLAGTMRSIDDRAKAHCIHLTASGCPLKASRARELSYLDHLILICGHYEGIDQRAIDSFVDEEISIGDFVLTSGCPAALSLIDAIARFIPGVLGHPESAKLESFERGLLEAPQYTRPQIFEEKKVPDVLYSGDHQKIAAWKQDRAIDRTRSKRPDLFFKPQKGNFFESALVEDSSFFYRSMNAMWSVGSLDDNKAWFGKTWPFKIASEQSESISIAMGKSFFELKRRPCRAKKGDVSSSFFIDLPQDLSRMVWRAAQTADCEIIKSDTWNQDRENSTFLTCQVRAIDPEGITWHWNCFF